VERIGRYEIRRELGRGSMSIVYEGFDSRIDRSLGIKVLREHLARDVNARQRFLREARAAGGLSHPNITTVFDVGQHEGLPFLAMERLSGNTLAERLKQGSEFDVETLLKIALQLAAGLDYAHRHGVIHRDLKPANIHLDPDSDLVKIMDFGIAAIERGAEQRGASTVAGTPTHMAPEQLTAHRSDERSDLYSLGVVLFEMLSGQLPFDATDSDAVIDQVVRHQTRPLKPRDPNTPRELVDLVYRLMAREPESRPVSARQVVEELEEIRSGLHRGLLQTVRQQSSLLRWPLGIGAAVAVVLVLGLWYVYRSQTGAIESATYGYGDALASLIAQETAEALILEDTTALSILVSDFSVNPQVDHLHVADAAGVVQASTNPFLQGQPVPGLDGRSVDREAGSVVLARNDDGLLQFSVPIRFQARRVGEVRLGLDGSTLDTTAATTLGLLALVFSITVLVVAMGVGWMMRRQQRAMQRLAWGLKRLARGQVDFRLEAERRDEFSDVYRQFNRLAVRLDEHRAANRSDDPTEPLEAPTLRPAQGLPDDTLDLTAPAPSAGDSSVTPLRKDRTRR
jgi:serine/threonine-protein kinase